MKKKILGVNIDYGLTMNDVVSTIDELIKKGEGSHLVSTTSPYFVMAAQNDPEFKDIINNSVISTPDGVGVLYAKYYLDKISDLKRNFIFPINAFLKGLQSGIEGYTNKKEFGDQITGVDLTYRLFELAEQKKYTVFLLGGKKRNNKGKHEDNDNYDMATEAAKVIRKKHPNIRIVGSSSEFSRDQIDDNNTIEYIHKCMKEENIGNIDILLVAYNPVGQEKWIERNAKYIPATISVGVGRTFDYITNIMKPPAKIYERMHIAWLYALIKQPWRYKRVFMTFPLFPLKVFKESLNK